MRTPKPTLALAGLGVMSLAIAALTSAAPPSPPLFTWSTVVNNNDEMPDDPFNRTFNSYNQPSVNVNGLVVIRARSQGGGGQPATHGIYTRDMAAGTGTPVKRILDRSSPVPEPNNLGTLFIETPSFPRIDMTSNTIATRGNHQPVWKVTDDEKLGTTGIYSNPFGDLITGASKLGIVPEFSFFAVPEAPGTPFDVFPGAPAVTDGATIVFKGNYTVDNIGMTGVYYRDLTDDAIPLDGGSTLEPAGGINPVVLIANNNTTKIPGTTTVFGSTAPPSAATVVDNKGKKQRMAVFAGFDDEENPALGGIYLAPLEAYNPETEQPELTTLVSIGGQVPGEKKGVVFTRLGEGVSFDGRFVAFWGAWGTETKSLTLQCREDGNPGRVEFCKEKHPDGYETTVPVNQGFFVHDLQTRQTLAVAKTPGDFDDFVYWNFSGLVPGTGESDEDGEPARWRSASFVAVSGLVDGKLTDATFHTAFKARTGDVVDGAYDNPVDGIYLKQGPGASGFLTVVETGMDGTLIDPEAVYVDKETTSTNLPVTEMGVERDGFRGNSLAVNVSMGTEEAGWAGVYLTIVSQ
jgi:hypothetical protein